MQQTSGLVQLIKCRWREFCREPSALYWVIFMPIFWMMVLGAAFSGDRTERFGVGVYRSGVSETLGQAVDSLNQSPQLQVVQDSRENLDRAMLRGDIVVIVEAASDGVKYVFDPKNSDATRAQAIVDDKIQRASGRLDTVPTMLSTMDVPGGRYIDFLIPGLLGLSIMSTSLFGIAMTIVSNRKENILKLFMVTPMTPSHYLLSHIIGRFFSLAVEFTSVMICGWLIFGFKVSGNFFEYVGIAALGAACFTAIAMAFASRTRSIPAVSGMTNLFMIVMVMLSGVFFAKSNFPDWLQPLVNLLPLTALVDGLRRIAIEGAGFIDLQRQLLVLTVYTAIGFVLTKLRFRWF